MLEIRELTHAYPDGHVALRDLTLRIETTGLVSIVGPSGCGKSTLLRCVAGLQQAQGGEVLLDGERVSGLSARVSLQIDHPDRYDVLGALVCPARAGVIRDAPRP